MTTDNDKPTLLSALLAVQGEMVKVKKTATNPAFRSKYVTLEALHDAVLPILNKHGLVWLCFPEERGDQAVLHYEIVHVGSEQQQGGTMPLLIDKQNPQGMGSAITYARRQSLMAVVGIVGEEDDDGNAASRERPLRPAAPPRATSESQPTEAIDRLLRPDEQNLVADAVQKSGQKLELLLASVGAESIQSLTVKQGQSIMKRLRA